MYIHVVQPGDTVQTIASSYGVDPERLALDNDITDPMNLIIGEVLVILVPNQAYLVQEGDTLESIATTQGTTVMELLRNNPNIAGRGLYIGENLVISYVGIKEAKIKTNGFAYPFISIEILRKTLPYLTYLTIYAYEYKRDGSIIDLDDLEIIKLARDYGVVPIMLLAAASNGNNNDDDIAHILISDRIVQDEFIENILTLLHTKGYSGINIETPFIKPGDREAYVNLIAKITARLNSEGYVAMVTIEPSTFEVSTGMIYSGVDYTGLSNAANNVLYQLTYAWRYPNTLPISVLPFNTVMDTLANAVSFIPPEKCILGISNIGYLWEFPYFSAITIVNFLNINSALELAKYTDSFIQFNERTRSAYYSYIENEREYMAWFKDNRVIYPMLVYSQGYGMQGLSIWNIMHFVTNTWLMINAQYEIEKLM